MMKPVSFALLALLTLSRPLAAATGPAVFNVLEYGAVADGRTKNTAAIQKAITAARDAGGGTVWVPAAFQHSGIRSLEFT